MSLARTTLGGRIARARGDKPPSLLLDLRSAKHRTEVEFLNGAVARAAYEAGVPAPVNAHTPQLWAKYRERPAALCDELRRDRNGPATAAPKESVP